MSINIDRIKLEIKADQRGKLLEIFKGSQLNKVNWGQVYVATLNPGAVRGNHYHQYKEEWFFILTGQVELKLQNIDSRELEIKMLSGENPEIIHIPAGIAHSIKNISNETAILIAYINREFDVENPDTYSCFLD